MMLENKTAVIYGAGGAIGGAVARAFAREGAKVIPTRRDAVDALDETAVREHLGSIGRVDVSFNAIGPGPARERLPLTELSADAFARPIDFYTRANFITATAAARHMSVQGSGVILTLTAVPGRLPAARIGGQAPAWAAVEAFTRSLALEVGPAGVRVVCLRAHAIPETPLIEHNFATAAEAAGVEPARFQALLEQSTLLKRLPTLAEVADTAAFLASDGAGAMTGAVANLSAGGITD
jgi:NAD(P)-dependent dehydrogenase (short-subunit alcohol dehydrogenase family)